MKRKLEVYFDGSCEPINPCGTGRIGVLIKEDGKTIYKNTAVIGKGEGISNNVAEYKALIDGLAFLIRKDLQNEKIEVYGDSKLVIEQMAGNWKIKKGLYKESAILCKRFVESFIDIMFRWIPREENYEADELSKYGIYKDDILLQEYLAVTRT